MKLQILGTSFLLVISALCAPQESKRQDDLPDFTQVGFSQENGGTTGGEGGTTITATTGAQLVAAVAVRNSPAL